METLKSAHPNGSHRHPFQFCFSATFTAEPIQPVVSFWGKQLNTDFAVSFAPYNQLYQTLLDPIGEFARNQNGVNVLLVRLEDLSQFDTWDEAAIGKLEESVRQLVEACRQASGRMPVPLIFCFCPPSEAFASERAAFSRRMCSLMESHFEEVPGIQFLKYSQILKLYPVDHWNSPQGERLGRIPYTEAFFCALGTAIVRQAHALFMPPYKVIALDCDNTLWQGICGEDGPRGVVLDAPRRVLQEFVLDQREAGMLLSMASKNNEQDVIETFEQNPDMPLQLRHFVSWRLNWQSKPRNLASLSEELSLGLDSFIFIDDNPKECAEVEDGAPDVLTLALPAEIEETPHFLEHVWAFDHPIITEED
ncbi:MAG: HAD-IIIC family phosphatase, partial [Bryobacteraceae bacterium]